MTLPLNYLIADDIAWITVTFLVLIYIYRTGKASGQYDRHCPICKLDVRKIKENNSRYFKLVAHDKFTWRNPLAFYQTYYFCSFKHLELWLETKLDIPTILLPTDEELDKLGSKPEHYYPENDN